MRRLAVFRQAYGRDDLLRLQIVFALQIALGGTEKS